MKTLDYLGYQNKYDDLVCLYNSVFYNYDVPLKNKVLWKMNMLPKFSEWNNLIIGLREFSVLPSKDFESIRTINNSHQDSNDRSATLFYNILDVFVEDYFIYEFYNKKYSTDSYREIEEAALFLLLNNYSYKNDLVSFLEIAGLGKEVLHIIGEENIPSEWRRTLLN